MNSLSARIHMGMPCTCVASLDTNPAHVDMWAYHAATWMCFGTAEGSYDRMVALVALDQPTRWCGMATRRLGHLTMAKKPSLGSNTSSMLFTSIIEYFNMISYEK